MFEVCPLASDFNNYLGSDVSPNDCKPGIDRGFRSWILMAVLRAHASLRGGNAQ